MYILVRASRAHRIVQAPPYHGSGRPDRAPNYAALALVAVLGLASGACSMSMELGSLFPDKADKNAEATTGDTRDVTGSLPLQAKREDGSAKGAKPADWSYAIPALREALNNKEEGSSVPWQNPSNGSHGTVTPVAKAYIKEGFACRNFLASHVGEGSENWFEGTACRIHRGEWEIRSTRPLQKS